MDMPRTRRIPRTPPSTIQPTLSTVSQASYRWPMGMRQPHRWPATNTATRSTPVCRNPPIRTPEERTAIPDNKHPTPSKDRTKAMVCHSTQWEDSPHSVGMGLATRSAPACTTNTRAKEAGGSNRRPGGSNRETRGSSKGTDGSSNRWATGSNPSTLHPPALGLRSLAATTQPGGVYAEVVAAGL